MATTHTAESRRAFNSTVLPFVDWVQGRAFALTKNRAEAEDLVQDSLVRAFRHWHTYDPAKASIKAWLGTIVRNTFVNRYHAVNRRREVPFAVAADGEVVCRGDVYADDVQEAMEAAETAAAVRAALEAVPEEFRAVIVAVDLEGASYLGAAATLGIPKGTVMSRLYRGRRHLRAALEAAA